MEHSAEREEKPQSKTAMPHAPCAMRDRLTLIKIHNPFSRADRDVVPAPYVPGRTLLDIRNENFPLIPVTVSVNGNVVAQEKLAITYPAAGDQILFVPVVQGGGDNSVLRSVLMLVITAVASYYLGPAGQGLTGMSYSVAMGAAMIVGGMLVNALLPPPKPTIPGDLEISQTYSWSPQTTQRQGIAVPKFYGTNKLYGNIIGAYLSGNGDQHKIHALIALGAGPMKRIYDYRLNDQAINAFRGVEVYEARGHINQDALTPFKNTPTEYALWVKVVNGSPYTYTTIGAAFDSLEIELTFPQGLWYMDATTGALGTHFVDVAVEARKQGDAQWVPLARQVVPAASPEHSITDRWSLGRWEKNVYYYTMYAGENNGYDWIEKQQGSTDLYAHAAGDAQTIDGVVYGWRWITPADDYYDFDADAVNYLTFQGASTKALRHKFTYGSRRSLAAGHYEIRITNLTADQTSNYYGDDLYLSAVREILKDPFSYPRLAHVGITALATDQLSGSLRFSCMAECSYVRIWNGAAWTYDVSDSPAWAFWDVLTQPVIESAASESLLPGYEYFHAGTKLSFKTIRYDGMDPARLDLATIKAWADWCAELVPDGEGGTEKRITFNGGFDTRASMWESALRICQVGRAMPVPWNGIGWTVAVDKAATPVQLFTVGNINEDSFRETFLKQADRASSLTIEFVDREQGYERDTFTVYVKDVAGSNTATLPLPGCTKRTEAWRHGKYRLLYNQYIKRSIEIDVGIDAIVCVLGDVVNVQHDVPQWGCGGRLVAADANSVTLDREVTIENGKGYTIMVRLMDDTVVLRSVTNAAGTYTVLAVSAPFGSVPVKYDLYAFGETGIVVKPFRVMHIARKSDLECTISGVEYSANVYAADGENPVVPELNYSASSQNPYSTPAQVTDMAASSSRERQPDGTDRYAIAISYKAPNEETNPYWDHADVYYASDNWVTRTRLGSFRRNETITKIQARAGLTYKVRAVSVSFGQNSADFRTAPEAVVVIPGINLPPDVSGLELFGQGNNMVFTGRDAKFAWRRSTTEQEYINARATFTGIAESGNVDPYFRDYQVQIYSGSTLRRTEFVTDPAYIYTFEKNKEDGGGTPVAAFTVKVWARDNYNYLSQNAAVLDVSNPAPDAPAGLSGEGTLDGAKFSWTKNTDPDIPITYSVRTKVEDGAWSGWISITDNEYHRPLTDAERVLYSIQPTIYIEVKTVDCFTQASAAAPSNVVSKAIIAGLFDNAPPEIPTGLVLATGIESTAQANTAYITASWTANAETDIDGYEMQLWKTGDAIYKTYYASVNSFRFTGLTPGVQYNVKISAYDKLGNPSAWTATSQITAATDAGAPAMPAGLAVSAGLKKVIISFAANSEADLAGYEVHVSINNDFIPDASTLKAKSLDTLHGFDGAPATTYYVKVRAYDWSGNYSGYTAQGSATTAQVATADIQAGAVTSDIVTTGELITLSAQIKNSTVLNQHVVSLSAQKFTGGTVGAELIYLTDTKFLLSGVDQQLVIKDSQAVPVTRVKIGKLGAGATDYGIQVYGSDGSTTFDSDGKVTRIANLVVTNAMMNDVGIEKLITGTFTSKAITLAVSDGTGDAKIQAGKTDFGDNTAGFILGIDDSDSNKAKFEIGNTTKYIKFDGTDVVIGPETRILGANAYSNSSIYFHMFLDDANNFSIQTTGGGVIDSSSGASISLVVYASGDEATVIKNMYLPILNYTWSKNRRWKSKVKTTGVDNNYLGYWGIFGTPTSEYIAFKLNGTSLYGAVRDASSETVVYLNVQLSGENIKKYEIWQTAANNVEFYVDGVYKGAITTGLPSGTTNATRLAGFYIKETGGSATQSLQASEAVFWQAE